MTELTLGRYKEMLGYLIDNNKRLIDKGDTAIAVCLEGEAGLGKTQATQQVAAEKGMTFVKVNLAQIEEPAELVGFPFKEYKVVINGTEQWLSSDLLRDLDCEFKATGESRMSYAVPAWVPRVFNPNGTMLLLDDFSRANNLIIQAVMEIINTGSYLSWELPKYTNIVLTSNPDNGSYSVTSLDSAVKSRLITFTGKFDIDEWAHWAEMFGLDGRAINFAMYYHQELFEPQNGVVVANARNYTTFCRAIAGVTDWDNADSQAFILEIASGCFLTKDNVVGTLFTTFISNKLDKLLPPEKMVNGEWKEVSKEIEACVYKNKIYQANIAKILGTRIMNYSDKGMHDGTLKGNVIKTRLVELYKSKLFAQDILFTILKTLCKNNPTTTSDFFIDPVIRDLAL